MSKVASITHPPNCIFCRIVKGDAPAYKVYEDEDTLAFLDIAPLTPGHTLIIPKKHYHYLHDMPPEDMARLGARIPKVVQAVVSAMGVKDYNILQNNGVAAGQVVFHVHFHIIPRRPHDGRWQQAKKYQAPDSSSSSSSSSMDANRRRRLIESDIAHVYQDRIRSRL